MMPRPRRGEALCSSRTGRCEVATELRRITAVTAVIAVTAETAETAETAVTPVTSGTPVTALTDGSAALHMFARPYYVVSQPYSGMPIVSARHGPVTRSVIIVGASERIVRLQRSTYQRRSNRRFLVWRQR